MVSLSAVVSKYIRPYLPIIISIIVAIILIVVGVLYLRQRSEQEKKKRFSDVANVNRRNTEAEVLFFNVSWCPHCKTAKPEWDTFESQNSGRVINGYEVKCVNVDCTDEDEPNVATMMNQYNIESFPTVKLLKDNQVVEFDSKITSTALESFVNIMLSE